ncbi:transcription-repair coupling factor [candidate division WOR-3 bacterium 4484_100]|uniref:Transcription-repair-coupling factor n=1 Tax=candidate division WOR-3 bacterium 4484_100 TaxID=1936077 RepID=A0A1V4QGJ7_UNCW3|nr:MAG: transcription-repair coupling factor [candidate division WOR-3 bacterium 4484_100]
MFDFNLENLVSKLKIDKKIHIAGLFGSAKTLFITELPKFFTPVLFITTNENALDIFQESRKIFPDTELLNQENPFYSPAKLIITTTEILEQQLKEKIAIEFYPGRDIDLEKLKQALIKTGFTQEENVEDEGEFAVRGGIIDIFEPGNISVRLELYGDKIISIRKFSIQNQRSIENLKGARIKLIDLQCKPKPLLDWIKHRGVVVSEMDIDIPLPKIILGYTGEIEYPLAPTRKYYGDLSSLHKDIEKRGYKFKFLVPEPLAKKLETLFGDIESADIPINEGFVDIRNRVVYLSETDIFGPLKKRKKVYKGLFVDDLVGLREGDYVVHSEFGIGQFKGLTIVEVENRKVECLQINYSGTDKLYLPVEKLNLLERYVGPDNRPPKLSRLGSDIWLKTKRRVRKATERMAAELLRLYARRMKEKGFAYSKDTFEMKELEASFPYEETPDQLQAILDVKRDMESPRPTERLICGDVGYGKTEIALRAAFKAALDGKQTALICPTTILALQHYNTFIKRLEHFPVNVAMLSRLNKRSEQKKIIAELAQGKIDIIIGTHRLLQPDIRFKDLGLMIIDEEQRFGVKQKERIKQLIPNIELLYLSATPIPRTLYMALTGIRDISNIYTPPVGRQDIITKVIYFNREELKKIIRFEIARGGQCFYVHNRIQTIESVRKRLLKMLPELKICLLHGRMKEETVARRMMEFLNGKYNLLLSTAIVESGLDMPRVNTIIVDEAHKFGLADLHQLRGRVGRGDKQGYAYFIVPTNLSISDEAHKRLSALISYSTLGSGFRLALRDMEIRGIGNLLGKEQSGYLSSIGYHHYIKLLTEAVHNLKGETSPPEPILNLRFEAFFPADYIKNSFERIALYKRLLEAESTFEIDSIRKELIDRFGRFPETVENLFRIARIRLKAKELGATEVTQKGEKLIFHTRSGIDITDFINII